MIEKGGSMMRRLLIPVVMALLVVMAPVATAFADSKIPVNCSLTLFVTSPGTDVVKVKKNHIDVKNSGQVAAGVVDCGAPTFDANGNVIATPDHPLDGYVTTDHGSKVKLNPVADEFSGKLRGDLTLVTLLDPGNPLTGEIKAKVSGSGLGAALLGDPTGLVEAIDGKWKLEGGDMKAEGTLSVGMAFDPSLMTLVGGGSLTGEMELNDDSGHDEHGEHGEHGGGEDDD